MLPRNVEDGTIHNRACVAHVEHWQFGKMVLTFHIFNNLLGANF